MTDPQRQISENDLQAFVDERLPAPSREAVAQFLENNPMTAQRVAAYQIQRHVLREAFANRGDQSLPPQLNLQHILAPRLRRRPTATWRTAAAVALALAVGAASGRALHFQGSPDRTTTALALLQQEAFSSHAVYATDRGHAVEVAANEVGHLQQWLSTRLHRPLAPPDLTLSGYRLIGGRLLATEQGHAAALFMYEDTAGGRLSLVMRPMNPDLTAPQMDFSQNGFNACVWIENGLGYSAVAALSDSALDRVVDRIKAEISARG